MQSDAHGNMNMNKSHYGRLLVMTAVSFIAMYILMYAMTDRLANVYPNFNQFYMAGLMTAAMVIIELLVMSGMYPNKRRNALFLAVSAVALIAFFAAIQKQTAISDRQFLRSMIPHHSGAILMCGQASLQNPELVRLCQSIKSDQAREIAFMKAKLRELEQ
jgi:uncharacterized protein (DUF305 family)